MTLFGPQAALDEVLLIPVWGEQAKVDKPIYWEGEWRVAALIGSVPAGQPVRFQVRGVTGSSGLVVSCKPDGAPPLSEWEWDVPLRFRLKPRATSRYGNP